MMIAAAHSPSVIIQPLEAIHFEVICSQDLVQEEPLKGEGSNCKTPA